MFNPWCNFDELGVVTKQVFSILLWKCNLSRGDPCNINDPFSGDIVFHSSTISTLAFFFYFWEQVLFSCQVIT